MLLRPVREQRRDVGVGTELEPSSAAYEAAPCSGPSSPSMRMTRGGRSRRENSTASAIAKFESLWSGATHRSSVNQTVTPLQSERRAAASS